MASAKQVAKVALREEVEAIDVKIAKCESRIADLKAEKVPLQTALDALTRRNGMPGQQTLDTGTPKRREFKGIVRRPERQRQLEELMRASPTTTRFSAMKLRRDGWPHSSAAIAIDDGIEAGFAKIVDTTTKGNPI